MKIINVSQIGYKTKYLKVIGIKDNGCLVLRGLGENISRIESGKIASRLEFFEYDPKLHKAYAVELGSLKLTQEFMFSFYKENLNRGIGHFLEEADENVNVIEYDFNDYSYKRLFSIGEAGGVSALDCHIQMFDLSKDLIAVKVYNKEAYEIYLFDVINKKKIDVCFSEKDDMRYLQIEYCDISEKPYLIFVKNSKPDWKMEFFIHDEWEENEEFEKYKEEKTFLVSMSDIADNDSIELNDQYKIAQVGEAYDLHYYGVLDDKIVYSLEDLKKYHPEKKEFQDILCSYDIYNQNTHKEEYFGDIVFSKEGLYIQKNENDSIVLNSFDNSNQYILPYKNAKVQQIINGKAVLRFSYKANLKQFPSSGIIIFDMEQQKELSRHYSEDDRIYIPEFARHTNLSSKYFKEEDLLVLY